MDINQLWSGYDLNSKKQNTRCLAVNTILEGKYLVGPVLGQGGFGITYVGYDLNMETKIAIKEYFPLELVSRDTTTMHGDRVLSLSGEKSVTYKAGLKKYVAEAQNVSQFSEILGVVSVKDFFYANETAYIVMEFIDGISLKDYLKEKGGRLSEEETLKIMKPVLEALVQVHKAGIIHRDISPDNIMLTFKDGNVHNQIESVKLIDFGAARMTEKNDQKSLTIILKHGYAPEEQYRTHGEQGAWTDVYALCAVLYRMMTGETPVPAMDRMFKDELKTLEQCGAKVSVNTSTAILKGLAVKKDDRIQSVKELIGALYEGGKVKSAGKTKNNRAIMIGVGVLVIAIIYVAAMSIKNNTDVSLEETTSVKVVDEDPIGEAIVKASLQTDLAASEQHIVRRKSDGTAEGYGSNEYGQLDIEDWTHIAAVAAGREFSVGLREDGTVRIAGKLDAKDEVELWSDIIAVAAYDRVLFGLKKDGTVMSSGLYGKNGDYYEWRDIRAISCSNHVFAGLTEDGRVLICSRSEPDGKTAAGTEMEISGWNDVEHLICAQYAVFGLTKDGDVRCSTVYEYVNDSSYNFDHMESFHNVVQLYSIAGLSQFGVCEDGSLCSGGFVTSTPPSFLEWENLQGIIGIAYDEKYIGVTKDETILNTFEEHVNSFPKELNHLQWIGFLPEGELAGVTKDGLGFEYRTSGEVLKFSQEPDSIWAGALMETWTNYIVLKKDGSVWTSLEESKIDWEHVKQIEVGPEGDYCVGLMEDGTVKVKIVSSYRSNASLNELETWTGIKQIAVSADSNNTEVYGLKEDGTVIFVRGYSDEPKTMERWKDMKAIFSGEDYVAAIREDGTAEFSDSDENDYGQMNVESWNNLTQLALGNYHTAGLMEDGTVVAVGKNQYGQCNVEEWTNIEYIAVGDSCTLGIHKDGTLVVAGEIGW